MGYILTIGTRDGLGLFMRLYRTRLAWIPQGISSEERIERSACTNISWNDDAAAAGLTEQAASSKMEFCFWNSRNPITWL